MKRIWVLEELTDTEYPKFLQEAFDLAEVRINLSFDYQDFKTRTLKILSITPDPVPKMGFDEWW